MGFNNFDRMKAKPEHINAVMSVLQEDDINIPFMRLAKKAKLTQTQAKCAIIELEKQDKIIVTRQDTTPTVSVKLKR